MLISIVLAVSVTAVLMVLTDNRANLATAVSFAIICSGSASYVVARYILYYQTLIEQKNEALLQANQQLAASNADLEAYAHTVAHDLKGPLSNILGFASLLKRQLNGSTPPQAFEVIQQIERSSQKMDTIIQELLLLAQVSSQQVETAVLNMTDIVSYAERRLSLLLHETEGQIIYPSQWPAATGYAPWVEEIWFNYLSNGLKYGGQPPKLELGADLDPSDPRFVRFWVRDNGPGIASEDIPLLFKEFARLGESRSDSHGLGLSIVHRIVEKLGGQVGVESELNVGALFFFTLPRPIH